MGRMAVAAVHGDNVKAKPLQIRGLPRHVPAVIGHHFLGIAGDGIHRRIVILRAARPVCLGTLRLLRPHTRHGRQRHATVRHGRHFAIGVHPARIGHQVACGFCTIKVDGIQQLADIVLCAVIIQIKEVEVTRRIVNGPAGKRNIVLMKVIDCNGRSAVSGPVGEVRDDLLPRRLLRSLQEMRRRRSGQHPVAQNGVADADGRQQRLIFQSHSVLPP